MQRSTIQVITVTVTKPADSAVKFAADHRVDFTLRGHDTVQGDKPYVVALVGISQPGYQCLANAYLRESLRADTRLSNLAVGTLEFDTTASAWWIVYHLLSQEYEPDLVGFSVYCWNAATVYEILRLLRKVRPDLPVVLGGPEVGPIAEEMCERFSPQVVYVAASEGERVICDVVEVLMRDKSPRKLAYLPTRDAVEDMDTLPPPYTEEQRPPIDGSAYIETYRGCPHRCSYCYESKGIAKIRSFSWQRIAADIDLVAGTPGMRSFTFVDSAFNLTLERLRKLSDLLAPHAARGIRLHTIEVDIESIDDEQAALLVRAGVVSVETGPQTTGTVALEQSQRSFNRDAYLRGVKACRDAGITVIADLILGLPGDSVETCLESMRFVVQDADPGIMQASSLHVLPGTLLWDKAEELSLHYDSEPPHAVIQTADISFRELRELEVFSAALGKLYRI